MVIKDIIKALNQGKFDHQFKMLTCNGDIEAQKERYLKLLNNALEKFGDVDAHLISAPGRTEVGGNHTDHQLGRVLAASVNMDIACVVIEDDSTCEYYADDFDVKPVMVNDLEIKENEKNTSEALIRGTLARFKQLGYKIGGFKAYSHSNVLKGSGISSSAAFEVLIGTILSHLYNQGSVDPLLIAQIGQYAENHHFMKPCGLMDQAACSVGGFITIDFKDRENPKVEKIDYDFAASDYAMCIVDTRGDHADLSEEYGLMPKEMKNVAKLFGKEVLSELTLDDILSNAKMIREKTDDRSFLRAVHFMNETNRVLDEVAALKKGDMDEFNRLIIESGYSSYMYLQNVYSPLKPHNQELAVALCISEQMLKGKGSYRVHGGGLAGTIQAFVPKTMLKQYQQKMEEVFGEGSCFIFSIRPVGGYKII